MAEVKSVRRNGDHAKDPVAMRPDYAKEMGGRLFAPSVGPGCGATFTLEIPRADGAAAAPAPGAAARLRG